MGLRMACGCGTNLECGNNHTTIQRCETGMGMRRRRAAFARSAGYARAAIAHQRPQPACNAALFSVLQSAPEGHIGINRVLHEYFTSIKRISAEKCT
jgi:hypothetical protein